MIAQTVAKALGARKAGRDWAARCPAHDDREPSLSIRDAGGKVLVHCHAGCDQRDVLAALKSRGLWDGSLRSHFRRRRRRQVPEPQPDRSAVALAIWKSSVPATGTLVEAYLASRGLSLPVPPILRFHRGLKHPSGGAWPCMVALVTRGVDDAPRAIHRTFLAHDSLCIGLSKSQNSLPPSALGLWKWASTMRILLHGSDRGGRQPIPAIDPIRFVR